MTKAEIWLKNLFQEPLNGNPIRAATVIKSAKNAAARFTRADIKAAKNAIGIKAITKNGEVYWLDPTQPERKGFGGYDA